MLFLILLLGFVTDDVSRRFILKMRELLIFLSHHSNAHLVLFLLISTQNYLLLHYETLMEGLSSTNRNDIYLVIMCSSNSLSLVCLFPRYHLRTTANLRT
jgi:hypothetical protein